MIKLFTHKAPIIKVPLIKRVAESGKPDGVCKKGLLRLRELKKDIFKKQNLPVQNCAGSFFIRPNFKNVIKKVDPHELDIQVVGNNKVRVTKAPRLTREINHFVKKVPEFMTVFTHADSYKEGLDKHTLATFKKVVENPKYEKLNDREKNVVEVAALLHDLGKAYVPPKAEHAKKSSDIVKRAIEPLNMTDEDKDLVVRLVEHHHYAENIAKKKATVKEYKKIFSQDEFELLKVLTTADITSKKDMQKVLPRLEENKEIFAAQDNEYSKNIIGKTKEAVFA